MRTSLGLSLQAPPSRTIQELPPVLKTSPSEIAYSLRFLIFLVMTTEIFACDHALFPLSLWRRVTFLHSRRTVMDNKEILCIQSQQSSVHNYHRYNKSAHEDRAVVQSLLALHPLLCQQCWNLLLMIHLWSYIIWSSITSLFKSCSWSWLPKESW